MSYPLSPWDLGPSPWNPHPQTSSNPAIGFEGMRGVVQYSNSQSMDYQRGPPPPMQNYYPNQYPSNNVVAHGYHNPDVRTGAHNDTPQFEYPNYNLQPHQVGGNHYVLPPHQYSVESENSKNRGSSGSLMSKSNKKKLKKYAVPAAAAVAGIVIVKKLF